MNRIARALEAAVVVLLATSIGQLGCPDSKPPGRTAPAKAVKTGPAAVEKTTPATTTEAVKPAATAKAADDSAVAKAEPRRAKSDKRIDPTTTVTHELGKDSEPTPAPKLTEPTPTRPVPTNTPAAAATALGELRYLPAGASSALAIQVREVIDPKTASKLAGFAASGGAARLVPKAGEVLAGLEQVVFVQLRAAKSEPKEKPSASKATCEEAADNLMKLMAAKMPDRDAPPGVRKQIVEACEKQPKVAPCLAKAKELSDIQQCGKELLSKGGSSEIPKGVIFLGDFDAPTIIQTLPRFIKAQAIGPNALVIGNQEAVDAIAAARANKAPRVANNGLVTKLLDRVDAKAQLVAFLFGDGDPTKPEAAAVSMAFSKKVALEAWVKGNAPETMVEKLRDELSSILEERFSKLQKDDSGMLPKEELDKLVTAIRELASSLQLDNEPGGMRVRTETVYDLPAAIRRWSNLDPPAKPAPSIQPKDAELLKRKLQEELMKKAAEQNAAKGAKAAEKAAIMAKKKALEAKKMALEAKEKALRDSQKK